MMEDLTRASHALEVAVKIAATNTLWGVGVSAIGGLIHWFYRRDCREKEALTPFNRVVFVHPTSRRPMRLTRRKKVRARKFWNKRRRATRLIVSQSKRRST
jgi:hypothetical protein